ncbi:hypothetical protein E2C01_018626 [Portunus trituberculatus]|uniref:Uncharacterized protein n=1 Tax=Portunus trituberculatus TaxID=210409 RepID=A0A5B7DWQ1_PORTR|nr:hypothetical protein [Portunus trituberculatus]
MLSANAVELWTCVCADCLSVMNCTPNIVKNQPDVSTSQRKVCERDSERLTLDLGDRTQLFPEHAAFTMNELREALQPRPDTAVGSNRI